MYKRVSLFFDNCVSVSDKGADADKTPSFQDISSVHAIVTSICKALDEIKGTRGGCKTKEAEFITKLFKKAAEGAIVDHNFSERYVYDILGLRRPRRMAITTDNEDGDIDADSDTDEDDDVNDHDSAEESDDGVLYELVDGDDAPDEIVATTKRPWYACISMKNQARDDRRDLSVAYEFHHSSFMVAVSMHHIVPNYLL